MRKFARFLDRLAADESGATLVEYTLLLGLITIALVGLIIALRGPLQSIWTQVGTAMTNAATT
jgi:pilus assembly protein Flp/PilA